MKQVQTFIYVSYTSVTQKGNMHVPQHNTWMQMLWCYKLWCLPLLMWD